MVRSFRWLLGACFLAYIISSMMPASRPPAAVPALPAKTPAELAEEARREAAFDTTVAVARALKDGLRDPGSLAWESIRANDDASLVCLRYRARNGFGGINREFAVVDHGKVSQRTDDWNRRCTAPLVDMGQVSEAL